MGKADGQGEGARTRRANGMGTEPKKQENGKWRGQIWVELPNGERKRRWVTGSTKAEVQRGYRALQNEAAQGIDVSRAGSITLQDFSDEWLRGRLASRKASTVKEDGIALRRYILPALRGKKMKSLTSRDVERVMASPELRSKSPRTQEEVFRILSALLSDAERDGVLAVNPARRVRAPSVAKSQPATKALTASEISQVMAAAHKEGPTAELRAALAFLGLRAAEALGLAWSDVELDRGFLTVNLTRTRYSSVHGSSCASPSAHSAAKCPDRRPNVTRVPPKTRYSSRRLYFESDLAVLMRAARREQEGWRRSPGEGVRPDPTFPDPLIPKRDGVSPESLTSDSAAWTRRLRSLGLVGANLHSSRHSAATRTLSAGIPLPTVRELLGHSSMASTSRYLHGDEVTARAASSLLLRGELGEAGAESREERKRLERLEAEEREARHVLSEVGPPPLGEAERAAWDARVRTVGADPRAVAAVAAADQEYGAW